MKKNPKTTRNPRGAGMKRSCYCDRWGCVKCMQRYIREAYRVRKEKADKDRDKSLKMVAIESPNRKYKNYTVANLDRRLEN